MVLRLVLAVCGSLGLGLGLPLGLGLGLSLTPNPNPKQPEEGHSNQSEARIPDLSYEKIIFATSPVDG